MTAAFFLGLRMPAPVTVPRSHCLKIQNGELIASQGEDVRYLNPPHRILCPCCGQWFTVNPDGTPAR